MSLKPSVVKIQNDRRYLRIAAAFILLFAGMFLAKLPQIDTLVQAAAPFLKTLAHNGTLSPENDRFELCASLECADLSALWPKRCRAPHSKEAHNSS
jgi:hypothetical protein